MTQIYATSIPTTLAALINEFATPAHNGQVVEAWLFSDLQSRRAAETELARHGVTARIRSAYKPLVHFFLEEIDLHGSEVTDIRIRYPQHKNAIGKRFLLEAYPLAAMVGDTEICFEADEASECCYEVILTHSSGKQVRHAVFAPNHLHQDCIGNTHLSPTGWIRVIGADGKPIRDTRLETDYERLFHATIQAITQSEWGSAEPFFETLKINVELPGADQSIAHDHEVISLAEALHEDLYFSVQEFFQARAGRSEEDRGGQPGQIVPEVCYGEGALSVTVETQALSNRDISGTAQVLDSATAPITRDQVEKELSKVEGTDFTARSCAGRTIYARYKEGSDAPVLISGGQHANETTGVVGALRAAQQLAQCESSHFVISPLENPDGYALHQALIADNPHHMHHAARYTALGDDLGYRSGAHLYEMEIRQQAWALSQAQLHINLHGYPSHEWSRPLSGYVPRGFDMWTLPKGFFLILRHCDEWTELAERFIHRVTQMLADIPGLLAFNDAQIALYQIHAGETGFHIINGFPCLVSADDDYDVPMQLITEYPDETIYGDHFIKGHSVQMQTVLAAYDAYQELF